MIWAGSYWLTEMLISLFCFLEALEITGSQILCAYQHVNHSRGLSVSAIISPSNSGSSQSLTETSRRELSSRVQPKSSTFFSSVSPNAVTPIYWSKPAQSQLPFMSNLESAHKVLKCFQPKPRSWKAYGLLLWWADGQHVSAEASTDFSSPPPVIHVVQFVIQTKL